MLRHVRQRLAHDGEQAIGDRQGDIARVEGEPHVGKPAGGDGALQLGAQVERIVVQVVHACAHGAHGLVQRLSHSLQLVPHLLVVGMHHLQRLHLHDGAREQMPHVVVDLARDAPALGERGKPDFVVLRGQQVAVLLRQGERRLLLVVA